MVTATQSPGGALKRGFPNSGHDCCSCCSRCWSIGSEHTYPCRGSIRTLYAICSNRNQGGILDLVNMFGGGALERMSILALGVMPYITSSIVMKPPDDDVSDVAAATEGRRGRSQENHAVHALRHAHRVGYPGRRVDGNPRCPRPGIQPGHRFLLYGADHPGIGRPVPDVVGGADNGTRCRQRHIAIDFRRHRIGLPGGDRTGVRSGPAGRSEHHRAAGCRRFLQS